MLVSLVVIFVPMLLEQEPVLEQEISGSNVPPPPDRQFQSRVIPQDDEPLQLPAESPVRVTPLQPAAAPPARPAPVAAPAAQPAAPKPLVGVSAWMIQIGSFSNHANADKLVERLRGKSFTTDIEEAKVGGKTVYRVLVGPEVDRQRAEKLLARLNAEVKDLKLTGKLRRYP